MTFLTKIAIKRPVTIMMFFIGITLLGIISYRMLPVQLFPNMIYPKVYLSLVMPGASPEKIEKELVIPAEGEIGTLKDIKEIESLCHPNYGVITISYDFSTDMKYAFLKLQHKVNTFMKNMPQGANARLERFDTSDFTTFLMDVSIEGELSEESLKIIAEETVKPRLEQIDGIVYAGSIGGRTEEIEILVNEDRAKSYGVRPDKIYAAVNNYNKDKQFLGKIFSSQYIYFVSIDGKATSFSELGNIVVDNAKKVKLRDVAEITRKKQKRTQIYRKNGKSSVGMMIKKDDQSNMLRVSENVINEIESLNRELKSQGAQITVNFNQAEFMGKAINKVKKLALVGIFLALLVLLYFLRDLKVVSVLVVAIPISIIVTFNLMYYWNVSVNILSLCGIAFAVGLLVDNGIVVLESIYRHYERGAGVYDACVNGTGEVSRAIIASTLTTIIVFLPAIFVKNEVRMILRELSLSVIFPLVISLFVAMTLIPMLTSKFLTFKEKGMKTSSQKLEFGRLLERYAVFLKFSLRNVRKIVMGLFILLIFTLVIVPIFLFSTEEESENTQFDIYVNTKKGTTLDDIDAMVKEVETLVDSLDDLKEYRSRIQESDAMVTVELLEKDKRKNELNLDNVKSELKKKLKLIPGGSIGYKPLGRQGGSGGGRRSGGGDGGDQMGMFGFGNQPGKIVIRGFDLDKLQTLCEFLISQLKGMDEIDYARSDLTEGEPEIQIIGDERNLAMHNLSMSDLMQLIWLGRREGNESQTKFRLMDEELALITRFGEKEKSGIENLKNLTIPAPQIGNVPLKRLSRVTLDVGPRTIYRHNQEREITITYQFESNVLSYKPQLEAMRQEVDRIVQNVRIPQGISVDVIHEDTQDKTFYWIIGISVLLIFMILASIFESLSAPFTILATVPLATIGAFWALLLFGSSLSQMAFMGMLILLGIVVNNGILFIDFTNYLRYRKNYRRERSILTAGMARVRPILMTAATTVFGLVPLMFKTGGMGEIWPPFAIAVVGGMTFATILTPLCIPVIYVMIDEIVSSFRNMNLLWKGCAIIALPLYVYYVHSSIGSLAWRIFFWGIGVTLLYWIIFKFSNFFAEKKKTVFKDDELEIYVHNLKKIYNGPTKLKNDLHKRLRKDFFLKLKNVRVRHDLNLKERLTWKIPVFGFLFYLNYYVQNWFAVTVTAVFSYIAVRNVWIEVGLFRKRGSRTAKRLLRLRKLVRWFGYNSIPVLFLYYLNYRWGKAGGVLVVVYFIWIFLRYAKKISGKIRAGEIDPDDITGRFRRIRRMIYRFIRWMPYFGAKNIEVRALNGVNLKIRRGMFGLLGPNGAGKTTLMRIICTIFDESRGSVFINKDKLRDNRDKIQSILGYLPQDFGVYANFTGYQYLTYQAILNNHWNTEQRDELIESILKQVGLWDRRNSKIKTFSGGMKQRIGIAQTLLRLPKIIVVDEPTAGLDPKERIRFRNLLSEMSKTRIVIFSTHIIEDISTSCNDMAVLYNGKVVFNDHPRALRDTAYGNVWECVINEKDFSEYNRKLKIVSHQRWKDGIKIRFIGLEKPAGIDAVDVKPTLEDAYLLLLSRFNGNGTDESEEVPTGEITK